MQNLNVRVLISEDSKDLVRERLTDAVYAIEVENHCFESVYSNQESLGL